MPFIQQGLSADVNVKFELLKNEIDSCLFREEDFYNRTSALFETEIRYLDKFS